LKVTTCIVLFVSLFLLACQNKVDRPDPILKNNNNVSSVSSPLNDKAKRSNSDPLDQETVSTKRAQALAILNYRLKKDPDFYTVMTEGVWELQFVHSGEMSKPGEYAGLPPGPICMPDVSSIDAVLDFEQHKYLYFCASPDNSGRHLFAKTLKEHNRNANRYRAYLNKARIFK